MKQSAFILIIGLAMILPGRANAEQADTYQKIKEQTPFFGGVGNKLYADSFYEHSFVRIGPRKIVWQLLTNRIMYFVKGQIPYIEINLYGRDRVNDVTLDGGSYFEFKNSVLHLENGFGFDADYIYRYRLSAEYKHRLVKTLFYKVGSRYLHYKLSDVFICSPAGVIIYYGNHYVTADYNFSITEGRGDAHWASAKVNLELHDGLNAWFGIVAGRRLFDIYDIKAPKQGGYILFTGADLRISDHVKFRAGYSYGEEKPNYLNRSVDVGLTVKF